MKLFCFEEPVVRMAQLWEDHEQVVKYADYMSVRLVEDFPAANDPKAAIAMAATLEMAAVRLTSMHGMDHMDVLRILSNGLQSLVCRIKGATS